MLIHLLQGFYILVLDFLFKYIKVNMLIFLYVVVTVDGTLLTKSGTMTGGTSGGMEARSKQWDDKKIEGLRYECLLVFFF